MTECCESAPLAELYYVQQILIADLRVVKLLQRQCLDEYFEKNCWQDFTLRQECYWLEVVAFFSMRPKQKLILNYSYEDVLENLIWVKKKLPWNRLNIIHLVQDFHSSHNPICTLAALDLIRVPFYVFNLFLLLVL